MRSRSDQPILKPDADIVGFLEACYQPEPDPTRWARSLMVGMEQVMPAPLGLGFIALAHEDGCANPHVVLAAAAGSALSYLEHREELERIVGSMGIDEFRAWYYPGRPVQTFRAVASGDVAPSNPTYHAWHTQIGAADSLALFAYPAPGMAVVLWVPTDRVLVANRAERRALERISGHLDSAFRLRYQPELAVAAVLSPAGKLLDIDEPAVEGALGAQLAARVVAIEGTRSRAHRGDLAALDHWHGLIAGRYSIVPRENADGKRCYLLVVNGALAQPHARFTQREIDVVRMAARGFTGKGIAYGLGLTPATVSAALVRAAAKVGLRSRLALIDVAVAMFGGRSDGVDPSRLTPAERDVLELLRRGMTNAEIGRLRARSSHTVANQVASMLRKTGQPSRRVLATAPLTKPR